MCYAVEEVGEFKSEEGEIMVLGLEFRGFALMRLTHLYSQKSHFQHILDWLHHPKQH